MRRVIAIAHREREDQVDRTRDHGRNCRAVFKVRNELRLQREAHNRRAEYQHAVERMAFFIGMAQRVEKPDGNIDREERDQEGLRARILLRCIVERAPHRGDQERRNEAEQVKRPPGSQPRDDTDGQVEQQVIAEQGDVIAGAGGYENRCCERSGKSDHSERLLVSQQREQGRQRAHDCHQHKRGQCRYQPVQLECCEDR